MTTQIKIAIASGIAVLLVLATINIYTYYSLGKARDAARQAELERAAAIAKVEEQTREAEARIRQAEERTTSALRIAEEANRNAAAAISRVAEIRTQRQQDLAQIPRLTDTGLTVAARAGSLSAYPDSIGSEVAFAEDGFHVSREFLEASTRGFTEVLSLRQENRELETAVESLRSQTTALLEALEGRKDATQILEGRVAGLEELRVADDNRIRALEGELRAEKRKNFWGRWYGRTLTAAAFVAGGIIGANL